MVPLLLRILDRFLKWYHFFDDFWPFSAWNGSILLRNFLPFSEMVPFLLRILTLFCNGTIFVEELLPFSEMVPFLLRNFDSFLKWYYFCWGILTLFWISTIFVEEFWPFSKIVPFFDDFWSFLKWCYFCWRFLTFSEMVNFYLQFFLQFLLTNFDPFLKWYNLCFEEFWPFSKLRKWFHFCWGGFMEVGTHWRDTGAILAWYRPYWLLNLPFSHRYYILS